MPITEESPFPSDLPSGAAGILTIDLAAVAANWRLLAARVGPACRTAAVVKADAYGLGAVPVVAALRAAGCRQFFVAKLGEGIRLAEAFAGRRDFAIAVLDGPAPGTVPDFLAHDLEAVLNEPGQVRDWARLAPGRKAHLQLDTGMSRLGLSLTELESLQTGGRLAALDLVSVLSHLACSDTPEHPLNAEQRHNFEAMTQRLPGIPRSLAASSGIFLGPGYHYDLARPGAALWGLNPTPDRPNPMRQVVGLKAKIIQALEIDASRSVGYGATFTAAGPRRLVTIGLGYADGILRAAGNRARAHVGTTALPVIGRISMDLITLDASDLTPDEAAPGRFVDLIGPAYDADALARDCGTIGYELLTRLSHRLHRSYLSQDA